MSHTRAPIVPETNQTTFVLDGAFGVHTRVRAHARAGALPRARVRAAGGHVLAGGGAGKERDVVGFSGRPSVDRQRQATLQWSIKMYQELLSIIGRPVAAAIGRPRIGQNLSTFWSNIGRPMVPPIVRAAVEQNVWTFLVDHWSTDGRANRSSKTGVAQKTVKFWSTIGRPVAAAIGRPRVEQKIREFLADYWSTDGARHRSSRGRAKASGILGRPLRHRGRGLRSTEVEHFCGEVRADGWPTSVASSEVCFLLCAACFKWPCGRFRRQAVSRQWFFFR